ncbi:mechanosensitive ion channel family protein [Mucilaginibacter sp. OK283]|uniref:mechanosensitive ion channel family protein n=1 Tax=Mucilaginibacter sp. OK283 TaxID=1881049 RepID=UPI0008D27A36|nr:mechanosensitive ion channel domain-containing protein [Mucilaginibacter sp. OK283]SEO17700.1 small conductance mechanosensitive channel [Mucilaginibacter sp. OK283]
MQNVSFYSTAIIAWLTTFGVNLLSAALVLAIGLYIIKWIGRLLTASMAKGKIDVSLQTFLGSVMTAGLRVLLLITVAGMLGIQTTSFVAIIGALGLAVGLALQGSLANFAGGVLILIFKPFKVGDIIDSQGQNGAVIEIQIFNTILLTPDNKTVILANGAVSNNTIVNYSRHGSIRVDISLEIDPQNDMDAVRKIAIDACLSHPLVLANPSPVVNLSKINEGKIGLGVCPFTKAQDYWTVLFGAQELIKKAFDEHKIGIHSPHLFITQVAGATTKA